MTSAEEVLRASANATRRERLLIAGSRGEAVADAGDQVRALIDLTATLERAGITCALIGGLAVGIHSAVPRATMDVDVAVPTAVPRDRVIKERSGTRRMWPFCKGTCRTRTRAGRGHRGLTSTYIPDILRA